ncbi:crotonase/enoyl-CoA hydratase family protein [Rhodococcus sp. D2-41]|uniref:Crotonase/enoyl-CoA hydratase family protein n=1 Tax=Speluncibacter jeojiensis TaxID=2710754 RepID=A0A9X4M428_9ACTN|nr:crotonase/enoyl-CoA hydratase family protein [Rhodococcus sp. D2-41]MDG3009483.1 crotonase/enoyl-CoA hydratase family protein [Rhodococcus sp. D2-41]MDG3016412.1 crotonase/enoyl-CoA hydratase family protein [Corynebacteriales bacterium D3-21]
MTVAVEKRGAVTIVTLDRPEVRNAVDHHHASALTAAFEAFDDDADSSVAILHGTGGNFCAGADLKAVARGDIKIAQPDEDGPAGMGPTRLLLSKPVIAAVDGYAVAGGLELAIWADLRVADPGAMFGVFCRRWGVPLIDGGTVRLPRLIGHSHALDMILTGRPVGAEEAKTMGLANRVSAPGRALEEAIELAEQLAQFPQTCLRGDRMSSYDQFGLTLDDAIAREWGHGMRSVEEIFSGAGRFASGLGRHGNFDEHQIGPGAAQ